MHILLLLLACFLRALAVEAWPSSSPYSTVTRIKHHHRRRATAAAALITSAATESASSAAAGASSKTVLIVGNGGREYALAEALLPSCKQIYVAPGNAGTMQLPQVLNMPELKPSDTDGILAFAKENNVDLVVVGPEDPLVKGLGDTLQKASIPCFGPSAAAARLEGSKAWAKAFMKRHGIPTAAYATFTDLEGAKEYVQKQPLPVVVKASGLAGGKGVTVARSHAQAIEVLEAMMGPAAVFGTEAGAEVVIEECLEGEEVSMLALCSGTRIVECFPCARDYKRQLDGDLGPNTGGMGSIAPVPDLPPAIEAKMQSILQQVVNGMTEEGHPYHGVLYGGFMVSREDGEPPKVLEFNCRFGDPETQSLLPLLPATQNLYTLMMQCVPGQEPTPPCLSEKTPSSASSTSHAAATVIAASEGYPTATAGPVQPHIIHGLPVAARVPGVHSVVHAGTARKVLANGARVITVSGGRVLGVTGKASTLRLALLHAYHGLSELRFQGMQYRTDIGTQAVASQPVRVAILGSTKGTSVLPLLKGKQGEYEVVLVMSDQEKAGLLDSARAAGVPDCRFVGGTISSKEEMEEKIEVAMEEAQAEVLLLNGYNRILSPRMVRVLRGRCLNVHPSLLPDFAGHFDLAVHQAVLDAGRTESGCTIHFVTDEVDQGPALIQATCVVSPGTDTASTLKAKVQALETQAWEDALRVYRTELDKIVKAMMATLKG